MTLRLIFFTKNLPQQNKIVNFALEIQIRMKKIILILLPLALALSPLRSSAQAEHETVETSLASITVSVKGCNVHVSGANGETLEIFNVTGVKVSTIRIDSDEKTFTLNLPKGCYLLKIGKVVRKISTM